MADLPETPITREEQYFSAISGQSSTDDLPEKPITRTEQYLDYIAKNGTGGSSGGTTNYNDLSNKPGINGVTLEGNKTLEELGIGGYTETVIWENTGTTNPTTINLDRSLYDFDELLVVQAFNSGVTTQNLFITSNLRIGYPDLYSEHTQGGALYRVFYTLSDETTLTRHSMASNPPIIGKIVGIKFGGSARSIQELTARLEALEKKIGGMI